MLTLSSGPQQAGMCGNHRGCALPDSGPQVVDAPSPVWGPPLSPVACWGRGSPRMGIQRGRRGPGSPKPWVPLLAGLAWEVARGTALAVVLFILLTSFLPLSLGSQASLRQPAPTSISPAVTGCYRARKTALPVLKTQGGVGRGRRYSPGQALIPLSSTEGGSHHDSAMPQPRPHHPPAVSPATHRDHAAASPARRHCCHAVPRGAQACTAVCEPGWCQVQLTSPEWGPAELTTGTPQPRPPGDSAPGATPTLRMPQARFWGLDEPRWAGWLAEGQGAQPC